MSTEQALRINFADGTCWNIYPENREVAPFIAHLADVMQLSVPNGDGEDIIIRFLDGKGTDTENPFPSNFLKSFFEQALSNYPQQEERQKLRGMFSCHFCPDGDEILETLKLMQFASLIALDAATWGGMLIHGALIERYNMGVILAGPGGVGKTTACGRLPETWRALSDDAALVVRDGEGLYWAHPWPTWSRFLVDKVGGSWEVGRGVRLRAICFLSQSTAVELIPLGEGEMVCHAVETIEQASRSITRALDAENSRKLWDIYFRNICQMVKTVPGYRLGLDLRSPFYTLIEDNLIKSVS